MTRKCASTVCTLALAGLAACGGGRETVYIGVAGPLDMANGESMKRAAEMAVAEMNAAPRPGQPIIELVFAYDSADPQKAITIAGALRNDSRIVAVVGHVNSAASLEAATRYNAEGGEGSPVLQISPASSSPELSDAGPWTFRVTPTDLEFSPVLATHARELGRSRAAVLYANDDYGRGVMTSFLAAFRAEGGSVVAADPYVPGVVPDENELDPYLRRALGRGADALVIGGQAEAGVQIIRSARRLGYTGPILGSDGLTGIKDAGAVAESVFVSSAFLPDRPTEEAQQFVQRYRERYNSLPDHRGAMTYDVLYLLRDALVAVGDDRGDLRDYVASIGDRRPAFQGVSGTIAFDDDGDVKGKEVMVGVVRNGVLVTARTAAGAVSREEE